MDLFKECIPSLLQGNDYLLTSEVEEKEYSAYMVNRALSQHIDCLFYANEMNRYHFLDKKLQYDYLFYSIRKYKRKYQKWMKSNETVDIQLIKEYYSYSTPKAKQILPLLSKENLEEIKVKLDKGGKSK